MKINHEKVKKFFEGRSSKDRNVPEISRVCYQDKNPELAAKRDNNEKSLILKKLAPGPSDTILDLGCGVGRWMVDLEPHCKKYLGIDLDQGLLDIAHSRTTKNTTELIRFDLTDPGLEQLMSRYSPTIVIISGVMLYMEDIDVDRLLDCVATCSAELRTIYIREPVSRGPELILDDVWSEEMQQRYSAIYREADSLQERITKRFPGPEWRLSTDEVIHDGLQNRKETTQRYYLIGDVK